MLERHAADTFRRYFFAEIAAYEATMPLRRFSCLLAVAATHRATLDADEFHYATLFAA